MKATEVPITNIYQNTIIDIKEIPINTNLKVTDNLIDSIEQYEEADNDPSEENIGTGMVGAPACGDVMKLQIKCEPSGNTHVIKDVKFKTYGCGSAIASSSLITEMVKGKATDEATKIKNTDIATTLALPPVKIHCSVLAEDAIKAAVKDYEVKCGCDSQK